MNQVEASLNTLSIGPAGPGVIGAVSKPSAVARSQAVISRVSGSDDSQRADSACSEFGTKPPSLDGKSITSGTTFALDEKESLRPDDSASVKAAAEDDDSSLRESVITGSRMGSDLAIRARGIQLGDMPERRPLRPVPGAHGDHTPQSTASEQPAELNPKIPLRSAGGSSDALNVIYRQAPDEKLLEALAAPRDRLFLLRLEKDVIDFVQNSKSDAVLQGATLAGDHGASADCFNDQYASACRPAEENYAPRLTREEREEAYKLARQRIFGNSEETSSDADGDYGMLRTNSATNKSANGKKGKVTKPRRDDSDNFESRRQYTSYWGAQQQAWMPQPQAQYMPAAAGQYNVQSAPAYPPQMGHAYAQQAQQAQQSAGYPSMPGALPNPTYSPYPQYASQPAQQRYQAPGSPMTAFGSPVLPAAPPQSQGWQAGFSHPGFQAQSGPSSNGPSPAQGNVPYPFGQLPANVNPNDPKSQHPIPGSYNRNHAFNPKTQSFVPGGGSAPTQALQPPFTAPGSHHSSPQIGAPHLAYAGHPGAMAPPPPFGGGYSMARQGSNSSMAACFTPPHVTPPHAQQGAPPPGMPSMQHIPTPQHLAPQAHAPARANMPLGANQLFNSHVITYGNPASLPQKPASGI
ncbi:hypothetical protein ESCO_006262 [Escovopsis weberi]|uniref:SUZ domain-containing protein n=1 Tax=Escovopsis weberi TaxID=150374 RepID=A0A0M8MVE5_ESCWE|nr:hypothetical protein ESCO_006262 [Escovopsis weberi]